MSTVVAPRLPSLLVVATCAGVSGSALGGVAPRAWFVGVLGAIALVLACYSPTVVAIGAAFAPFAVAVTGKVTYGWAVTAVAAVVVLTRLPRISRRQAPYFVLLVAMALFVVLDAYVIAPATSDSTQYYVLSFVSSLVIACSYLVLRPPSWSIVVLALATGLFHSWGIVRDDPYSLDRTASYYGLNANGGAAAAGLGVLATAIIWVLLRERVGWPLLVLLAPPTLLCLRAMQETGSRGSFVAIAAALGVLALPLVRRSPFAGAITGGFALVTLILVTQQSTIDGWLGRTKSGFAYSDNARANGLRAALNQIPQDPFFGVGPGRIGDVVFERGLVAYQLTPHNAYIAVVSELGVFVLAGMVAVALVAFLRAQGPLVPIARTTIAYFAGLGFMLQWVSDVRLSAAFWAAVGASIAASAAREKAPVRMLERPRVASHAGSPARVGGRHG